MNIEITANQIKKYREQFENDGKSKISQNAVTNVPLPKLTLNRNLVQEMDSSFSIKLDKWSVTNQKSSGRCWLFATLNLFRPGAMERTIKDFVKTAVLAKRAGYSGVEVMGSEGYLINEFIASETNHRTDKWGGSFENRIQFPKDIVRRIREAVGPKFLIMYRLSMLDLVDGGSSWEEVEQLAKDIEVAGADVINTGIGWHEARMLN